MCLSDFNPADCSHSVAGSRLRNIILRRDATGGLSEAQPSSPEGEEIFKNFHHFTAPTLPHLLALLTHASPFFPPEGTSLIVVEAVSSLFNIAYPKITEVTRDRQISGRVNDPMQWAAGRKWAVMGDFTSKIGKLAAIRRLAMLVTTQTTTRVRAELEASLYPAVSGTAWDNGIHSRIVLFRDWLLKSASSQSRRNYETGSRCAAIVKAGGVLYEGFGKVAFFTIKKVLGQILLSSCIANGHRMASSHSALVISSFKTREPIWLPI